MDPRQEVSQLMSLLLPSLELAGKDIQDYYLALHHGEEWAIELKARIERKRQGR